MNQNEQSDLERLRCAHQAVPGPSAEVREHARERLLAAIAEAAPKTAAPRRRFARLPAVTLVALVGTAGAAVAATQLLDLGKPVDPAASPSDVPGSTPDSYRLVDVRVPDPDGGPDWGLATYEQQGAPVTCAFVGRVQGTALGVIGADGLFADDGRFHELRPSSPKSMTCGGGDLDTEFLLGRSAETIPANGYTGVSVGADATSGCAVPGDEAGRAACESSRLRRVKYGFAGRKAVRVRYGDQDVAVSPASSGAYLFVSRVGSGGGGRVTVTYADGTTAEQ